MADSVWSCKEEFGSACKGLPADKKHEGKQYCVLHFPSVDKDLAEFEGAIEKKLKDKDFDFRGVYFPGKQSLASFLPNATFEGTANFSSATVKGKANFAEATFKGEASFSEATFKKRANFSGATFGAEASFYSATFGGEWASLSEAIFGGEADFHDATFEDATFEGEASFSEATFKELADFSEATFGVATFRDATFGAEASFSEAIFGWEASFYSATFEGEASSFCNATFRGKADFSEATFKKSAYFFEATFGEGTYVYIGEGVASFIMATFEEGAEFYNATFKKRASFTKATFGEGASFHNNTFKEGATFTMATFGGEWASFYSATFEEGADFYNATFEREATFTMATFEEGAEFRRSIFKEKGSFLYLRTSPQAFLSFREAVTEKPERLTFRSTHLRPSWFVGVDARKFDFTAVQWYGLFHSHDSEETFDKAFDREIKRIREKGEPGSPYNLLAQACRRLSANAEDNREYPLANEFHYWSMDALRTESRDYRKETRDALLWIRRNWLRVAKRCGPATTLRLVWSRIRSRHQGRPRNLDLISTLYWALNGYGVRAARAFLVLLGLWAAFTTLYVLADPSEFKDFGQGVGYLWQAAVYSLLAMARLNPEPTPGEPGLFQFLVGLEGILGPLQIALLVLAVRRKVMR